MTIERAGALALILGTVAMLGVMALHPSGVPHTLAASCCSASSSTALRLPSPPC